MIGWLKRKGAEKAMATVLAGILRHALTIAGGAGLMSGDEINQAAGALATLIGLAWSIAPKLIAARKEA